MNILIVKLSAIGDVIHTMPPATAIRRHFPEARITWLIEEAAADLVIGHPAVNRVIVSGRKRWLSEIKSGMAKNAFHEMQIFFKAIRDTRYDMLFDFQALLKSGVLIAMAKADRKIGFDKGMQHQEHSHIFLNERIPPVSMEIHAIDRGMMLINAAGIPGSDIVYGLKTSPDMRIFVEESLRREGVLRNKPLVVIHPAAKWETKMWLPERFAVVADEIISRYDAEVIFTGSSDDIGLIEKIIGAMKMKAYNFCGKTRLKVLSALLEAADMLVCTDTGPMHLAAAVETPTVALFGPTAPWRTGPYGAKHEVVRTETTCSPCFKRKCDNRSCMNGIMPVHVTNAVDKIFRRIKNPLDSL